MLTSLPGLRSVFAAAVTAAALAACGGGGTTPPAQQEGTLRVSLTDAPSCGFSNVFVTIDRVRVHQSSNAGETATGWSEIVLNPARKVDLLRLTNGVLEGLGTTPLPRGQYQQVRLVLVPNRSGAPANSVVPIGGNETPMDTPSAVQSGIKLVHPFTVEANRVSDLILDFHVCRSIVQRGNGSYGLKPVIKILEAVNVAAIVGNVAPGNASATVSAQKDGVVERSTIPNAVGEFTLAYLDPAKAPYDIVFTQPSFATAVVTGVPATTSAVTRVSTSAQPIGLDASIMRTASGALGPSGARETGEVRAVQAVGPVAAVEVATTNVNPTSGGYSLSLPVAAPKLATYSTTLPLGFSVVTPAAQYTLQASATGYAPQNAFANLSASSVTQNFALLPTP